MNVPDASGDAGACVYPLCRMRDAIDTWRGSPQWHRARANTSVGSAVPASVGHLSTGGADGLNLKAAKPAARWKVTDRDWAPGYRVQATVGTDERGIAQVVSVEDAELIVAAVNLHPRLVAVLRALCEAGDRGPSGHDWMRAHALLDEIDRGTA